ncbi:erythrocyte membrane protein 1 (PfEMP1), exon 2, putative [Plasmodium reichenowi]|uniref:Erythrocyte membrane protein 1 (PfEMP1), exon 2, putative n=1 Tax=Plasmodium reichenowi TaxID=5854 RepID=A0A2P9DSY5_PLARE|nr:erythrocyte membrane protein 1 (PfEMP1), exon 2, putative [Plasmodium reichenowi]
MVMRYLQRNHQIGMSRMNVADINGKHIFTRKEKKHNEWNQLKQDFIEQYLSYIEPSVPLNHELQTNNIYMYSQFNILHVIMDEKPFIISIQDRFLGSCRE